MSDTHFYCVFFKTMESSYARTFRTSRNCPADISLKQKRAADAIQANVKMSLEMAKSPFLRSRLLAGSTYIRASLCPWRSWRLRMRATSSGGFGSARGILERCCRPWPFWPRGTSNTTETEAQASLGSPYIGSRQLLHYSQWPMANRTDEVPIVVLRRRNCRPALKTFYLFSDNVRA